MAKTKTANKEEKATQVATTQTNGAALARATAPQRGFEQEVDQDDLLFPRVKLLQPTSEEITEGYEGLKPGILVNSITKEILPSRFVPVFYFKEFIRFNPRKKDDPNFVEGHDPGALIWKTADPTDPRVEETKFGPDGEIPAAQSVLNFFSYVPGHAMPVVLSFSKTSYKAGRQLISLAKFAQCDLFSRAYTVETEKKSNDQGTYFVLKVKPAGAATDEEKALAEDLWKSFANRVTEIQTHHDEDETTVVDAELSGEDRPY